MLRKEQLFLSLEKANIKHTDTVFMHSSMKAIGEVYGGINAFIDYMLEYLYDGIFALPTHTWDSVTKSNPIFDIKNSKSCVGIISNVALQRQDGIRSRNSTHSIVAFGKKARELINGEEKVCSPTSPNGVYAKFIEYNAKIMLVGVNHNKNTFIHCLEEIANVPYRLTNDCTLFYDIDENGIKHEHKMKEIFCPYHEDVSHEFYRLNELFERNNINTYINIGNAKTIVCSAKKLYELLVPIMEDCRDKGKDYLIDEKMQEYIQTKNK